MWSVNTDQTSSCGDIRSNFTASPILSLFLMFPRDIQRQHNVHLFPFDSKQHLCCLTKTLLTSSSSSCGSFVHEIVQNNEVTYTFNLQLIINRSFNRLLKSTLHAQHLSSPLKLTSFFSLNQRMENLLKHFMNSKTGCW